MPDAKKQTVSLKKQFSSKKTYKFIWKKATEPSSKIPEAKKTTLSLKKQFCFKKAYITESAYIEYGIGNLTIFTAFQELRKKPHT